MPSRDARHMSVRASVEKTEEGWIVFPLSSEEPYQRYDGIEILEHGAKNVDLSWLKSGNAPLLDNHDRYTGLDAQIGVIRDAWLDGKRVYVAVEFRKDARSQAIAADVEAGIIRNVSVGYEISMTTEKKGPTSEYRVTKWRPYEASFVPLPADRTVGVGRSATVTTEVSMTKPNTLPGLDEQTDEQRAEAMTSTINEIQALAATHNCGDLARAYISGVLTRGEELSLPLFRGIVAAKLPEGTPLVNTDIGLTEREQQQFSIVRLAAAMADETGKAREQAKFELEACTTAGAGRHGGFVLPTDLMRSWGNFEMDGISSRSVDGREMVRAAVSTSNPSSTSNIQTTAHLADRFIDSLRDAMVLGRLGLTMLPGLSSDIEIPGKDTNISAAWLASEDANVAESNPGFRKVTMAPHDLGAYTDITRRMLQQATIGIEALVRSDIVIGIAQAIDLAGFYGSGASGQPTGLANTSGIGSVTFAAAVPTRAELIAMRKAIRATNQMGETVMVMDTDMEADLMNVKVDAGSGIFLADGSGRLNTNDRYVMTNALTSGDIFNGVWSDMLMGMWGGLELARSTEAKFLSGGIRLRGIQTVDFGVRRVGSFVLGNDTP